MKNGPIPTLPNLIIIGAMKAGTTALHYYLSKHPQIFMSRKKELNYFDREVRGRDLDWYRAQFDANYPVNGEASIQYARFPRTPGVPARIRKTLADVKLIYMVRDPVDRLISHYTQVLSKWRETRSFSEVLANIENEPHEYIECSSYFFQLTQYFPHFRPEDIRVVVLERLAANPREELKGIFRFLGVDENFWTPEFAQPVNSADMKTLPAPWAIKVTPPVLRRQLVDRTWMPWRLTHLLNHAVRIGGPPVRRPKLTREDDLRLQAYFKRDVAALRDYLADPLCEWRPYA